MQKRRPVVLIIMDGIGINCSEYGNAVKAAYTPTLDMLAGNFPSITLKAHGMAVGLPTDSDMGNSEVGHNALGCGQIFPQGAKLVNEAIASRKIFDSKIWAELIQNSCENHSALHFIGLISDGNVHSNIAHLKAMIKEAKEQGVSHVRIHAILDGRDVESTSALKYIDDLEKLLADLNSANFDGRIASGGGRMKITMDRYEADWNMVRLGWETHVLGRGRQFDNAAQAIKVLREESHAIDQDLPPFVIAKNGLPIGTILDGDSVILFNFRGDRAIELSRAFEDEHFTAFERIRRPKVVFAGMLQYDGDLNLPKRYLVHPPEIKDTLTELLIKNEIREYAISETQKFGHVTYFWNGNRSGKLSENLETYKDIPSDRVPFEQRPWMKAAEITDTLIEAINSGKYLFLRANFPNGDMVGHTGNFTAAKIAVETVDLCLARILETVKKVKGILIVTADHGNADEMLEPQKSGEFPKVKTSHTLNPVPFVLFDQSEPHQLKHDEFGLANVAPTVAKLLGIEPPGTWQKSML